MSSTSSYYSIEDLLTSAQTLPCTFTLPLPGLGHLDSNPGGDIKPHHSLPLPLWLAELLAVQRLGGSGTQPLLTMDLPAALAPRVLHALRADAKSVDLRLLAQGGFYGLVGRIGELFEVEDVADVVGEAFKARAKAIADHAAHERGALGEGVEFLRGLDEMERRIPRRARKLESDEGLDGRDEEGGMNCRGLMVMHKLLEEFYDIEAGAVEGWGERMT